MGVSSLIIRYAPEQQADAVREVRVDFLADASRWCEAVKLAKRLKKYPALWKQAKKDAKQETLAALALLRATRMLADAESSSCNGGKAVVEEQWWRSICGGAVMGN